LGTESPAGVIVMGVGMGGLLRAGLR
jgi:hypothetical protein